MAEAITFLLFVLLTMCLPPLLTQASATTYHVDVNTGNDNYTGLKQSPSRRSEGRRYHGAGDKTLIHEGVYHEQILGGKSGLPNKPITYEGLSEIESFSWISHC